MARRTALSALLGLSSLTATVPSVAGDVLFQNRTLICTAASPDVVGMRVERVHFSLSSHHPSGRAQIRLQYRDGSDAVFDVSGDASRIPEFTGSSIDDRSLAYAGVVCSLVYPGITRMQNCRGPTEARSCEVGIKLMGRPVTYLVSLTIAAGKNAHAALPAR